MDNKKFDKKISKKTKIIISLVLVLAVILVSGSVAIAVNQTAIYTKFVSYLMPDSLDIDVGSKKITFYSEENEEYNPKTQSSVPLQAFKYYYIDENNNKVYFDGMQAYEDGDDSTIPSLMFLLEVKSKSDSIGDAFQIVAAVVVLILIAVAIFIWFKIWCRKEDEKKAQLNKNNNKNNKKKK